MLFEAPKALPLELDFPNARLVLAEGANASVWFWLLIVPNGVAPFPAEDPNGFEPVDPAPKPPAPNALVELLSLVEPNGDALLSLFKLPNGRLVVLFVDWPNPDWPKPLVPGAEPLDVDAFPNPDEPNADPLGGLPNPEEPNADPPGGLPNPVEPNADPVGGSPNAEVVEAGFELPKPDDPNADPDDAVG